MFTLLIYIYYFTNLPCSPLTLNTPSFYKNWDDNGGRSFFPWLYFRRLLPYTLLKVVTPVIFSKFKLNEEKLRQYISVYFCNNVFSSFSGPKIVILRVKIETFDQGQQFGNYCKILPAHNVYYLKVNWVGFICSPSTISDKIFGTEWRNPVKLDRKRKVWYLFLRIFELLLPKPNLFKGDWALGNVSNEILKF